MTVIDQKSTRPGETSQSVVPVPGLPRPTTPAHVIRDDAEAIEVANRLAAIFRQGAAERDRERIWPIEQLDAFSQSGLWSINVPKAFGGPGLSYITLNKVIEIISAADPSLAQIPQNHLGVVAAISTVSDDAQKAFLFAEVLNGTRFGNAFSEFGSKRAADFETKFTDAGDHVIVQGKKFYSTGALLAHLVPIVALDDEGRAWYAIADRNAPGLSVIDDWSAFGQRTTLSGTVILDNVKVPKTHLVPGYKGYEVPTADGAIFQVIQAAVDTGIARAAIEDTIAFVRSSSRAWVDSGVDHAWQDPYTIQAIGDLQVKLLATQALLDKSGLAIDAAVASPTEKSVAEA
jgi:SfnB family sulfur acquisition oxidoreductase